MSKSLEIRQELRRCIIIAAFKQSKWSPMVISHHRWWECCLRNLPSDIWKSSFIRPVSDLLYCSEVWKINNAIIIFNGTMFNNPNVIHVNKTFLGFNLTQSGLWDWIFGSSAKFLSNLVVWTFYLLAFFHHVLVLFVVWFPLFVQQFCQNISFI
jgi:hypothetical protein